MRKVENIQEKKLIQVICNCCGKELAVENGILKEECVCVEKSFGYFSKKDGKMHRFDLCEKCYDEMTARFLVPVEMKEASELI